jgi:hypothetical protein
VTDQTPGCGTTSDARKRHAEQSCSPEGSTHVHVERCYQAGAADARSASVDTEALADLLAEHEPVKLGPLGPVRCRACADWTEGTIWEHRVAVLLASGVVVPTAAEPGAMLREVMAKAWDEGFDAGERDVWNHERTGFKADDPCIPNPYCTATPAEGGSRG